MENSQRNKIKTNNDIPPGYSNGIWQRRIYHHIYPTPPLGQDMTQGQFLSGV